jgi:cell division septation protein DedD
MSDLRGDRNMRPVPGGEPAGPGARSPKRLITAGIALGAVAAFGIGIWFAYDQGVKRGASGAPPLIRADQTPTKVAPENPGGMQVPNQDKQIYERLPGNAAQAPGSQTERLLPPPERPAVAPTQPNMATSPAVTVPNRTTPQVPNRTDAPSATAVAPQPAQPAPGQPQPVTPPRSAAPAQAQSSGQASVQSSAPSSPQPSSSSQSPAQQQAARTVTATPGGSARIQLASLKDQAAATATWNQLQKKFPDILGGLQPSYEKVEIADKGTFIRLQAGPLKDRNAAQAACSALAAKNQGCIVVGR